MEIVHHNFTKKEKGTFIYNTNQRFTGAQAHEYCQSLSNLRVLCSVACIISVFFFYHLAFYDHFFIPIHSKFY